MMRMPHEARRGPQNCVASPQNLVDSAQPTDNEFYARPCPCIRCPVPSAPDMNRSTHIMMHLSALHDAVHLSAMRDHRGCHASSAIQHLPRSIGTRHSYKLFIYSYILYAYMPRIYSYIHVLNLYAYMEFHIYPSTYMHRMLRVSRNHSPSNACT